MRDLNDFYFFVQVVDRGGFTAAGRTLRVPKSTLSHRIQQLESELGVRLLNRTSRRFGMTDAGEDFYRHAVVMLREAELAETTIRNRLTEPTGTVRCTKSPQDLQNHPSLFMMRAGVEPVWRLRHARQKRDEIVVPLTPRLLSDDMVGLQQAAIKGLGIVALPGYICRSAVRSGHLERVLPGWIAGDSTLTALIPYRQGLLPSVRAFLDHLAAELPKTVLM
ncbi:LysR family transcriptional regulator [Chondromyces apiculatus]|uniref:Transcriptional regulator, LysR family n=1 Tax=Chondromyces apiculatus DSM 436 TaxID=1192034 RepID=A0A017TDE9_9BACT|nr:LysR family transcriptional regulator [Chondromyces apiculatus]EYF07269.1 transcriptional regulator, LysR family [Chondromyces apiculatus DSM 436]